MTSPNTALSVAEASDTILRALAPLPPERVALLDALGRVLAEPIVATVTLPPWTNSAMDGYAVRADDVRSATAATPVRMPVIETVAAGAFPSRALEAGEAVRIMTGAPVPEGADSVIRVEDTDGAADVVEIRAARDAGRNLRPRGEDMRAGEVVLAEGTPVGPGQVGALAACGAGFVTVYRRPRVAIIGSGDELVDLNDFHEALAGRKIVGTNNYALHAAVRSAGGIPVDLGLATDAPESLRERLRRAAGCDLIITSAGNSVGLFDHTRDVLDSLGAEQTFWRVRMRPGAPLGFGVLGATPWIGLPGNPVSALVTFELFGRPAVRRMHGQRRLFRRPVTVRVEADLTAAPGLTHFLRAVVFAAPDGTLGARLTGPQGSGLVRSVALADALLVVPEGLEHVAAGDTLTALLLTEDAGFAEELAL